MVFSRRGLISLLFVPEHVLLKKKKDKDNLDMMNFENTALGKRSQTQKATYCMIPFT